MGEVELLTIDNGSSSLKVGIAGEDEPFAFLPTSSPDGSNPAIDRGIISDWTRIESLWRNAFLSLKKDPKETPVLMTESVLNPKTDREKLLSVLIVRNVSTLYSHGRTNGAVLQSGDGVTTFAPIYEGHGLPYRYVRSEVGGGDLTRYLIKNIAEQSGVSLTHAEAENLKRSLCHVPPMEQAHTLPAQVSLIHAQERASAMHGALNLMRDTYFDAMPVELRKEVAHYYANMEGTEKLLWQTDTLRTCYTLPDGRRIMVGGAPLVCAEGLFRPDLIGRNDSLGVHDCMWEGMRRAYAKERTEWYPHLVIAGGNTMFEGYSHRLLAEMHRLIAHPIAMRCRILAQPKRNISAWVGISILGSLSVFARMMITKEDYDEVGPRIVHRMCW